MTQSGPIGSTDTCGACGGIAAATPVPIDNRPGLGAIVYRVGTHADFQRTLLADLSSSDLPALEGLRVRTDDDFTIALLDAFSVVADVLTFYQERIANESYLRTATERRSVLELARAIGYELRPGVAASVQLVFVLDPAKGAPGEVTIDVGTKVKSVPGPGEKAQTYETVEKIDARASWNALKAYAKPLSIPTPMAPGSVAFLGVGTGLKAGDCILFTAGGKWAVVRVRTVTPDSNHGTTTVTWDETPAWRDFGVVPPPSAPTLSAWVFRRQVALFGSSAPDWRAMPVAVQEAYGLPLPTTSGTPPQPQWTEWPGLTLSQISEPPLPVGLCGEYFGDITLTTSKASRVDAQIKFDDFTVNLPDSLGPTGFSVRWTGWLVAPTTGDYTFYTYSDDGIRLWVDGNLLINAWTVRSRPSTPDTSSPVRLEGGSAHPIQVEYFQNLGLAEVEVDWSGPGIAQQPICPQNLLPSGLYGEYFDGDDLSSLKGTRIDARIDFADFTANLPGSLTGTNFSVRWTGWIVPPVTDDYTFYTYSDDGIRLWIDDSEIINQWVTRGRPANPDQSAPVHLVAGQSYSIKVEYFQGLGPASVELDWSTPSVPQEPIPSAYLAPAAVHAIDIAPPQPQIVGEHWLLLAIPDYEALVWIDSAVDSFRAGFTNSSKTTHIVFSGEDLRAHFDDQVRQTAVFGGSESLTFAPLLDVSPVAAGTTQITLDSAPPDLPKGRTVLLSGPFDGGQPATEILHVTNVDTSDPLHTTLLFDGPLANTYDRANLVISANVAEATHGESVNEIVGSGDATQTFQQFRLLQSPVTYVAADNARGGASTLTVNVGPEWLEVDSLYGRGPRERVYVSRIDDSGQTTITFGDGVTGARLPTGQENVTAVYRKGIGVAGQVRANQLSLLVPRPLGLKSVNNPMGASGAQDPEVIDDARANAPRQVLTLDRVVSLSDYEDFANAFSGVGKALATWVWSGDRRGVLLTIADVNGNSLQKGAKPYDDLLSSLAGLSVPGVPVLILQPNSCSVLPFTVAADVLLDPTGLPGPVVRQAVTQALLDRFSFAARDFGQGVGRSEVIAAIQAVPGVVSVDLRQFHRNDRPAAVVDYLCAAVPANGEDARHVQPAELLIIDAGVVIT